MSKPTGKQRKVISYIQQEAKSWYLSNDISSPTHNGDIKSFTINLDLTEEQEYELEYLMLNLLNFVRSTND